MEKNLENFIICISISIISLSIGIYYVRKYKKENYKPEYGIKRDSNLDYYKDGFKILSYYRSYALIFIGALFFIFALTALFRN
jgi:hypothetical protein